MFGVVIKHVQFFYFVILILIFYILTINEKQIWSAVTWIFHYS